MLQNIMAAAAKSSAMPPPARDQQAAYSDRLDNLVAQGGHALDPAQYDLLRTIHL